MEGMVATRLSPLRELSDFQKLAASAPADADILALLRHPDFFRSPRKNDQISRQHARLVDRLLGLDLTGVEEGLVKRGRKVLPQGSHEYWGPALHEGAQTWVGLDPQTLNTPYSVLLRLCELLGVGDGDRVVDLGAAHGRMGLVMHQACPGAHFLGLEYVPERVEEANRAYRRWGCRNAKCEVRDLFAREFQLPEAEVYFIYDFGRHDQINATLGQISEVACGRSVRLAARGQATNRLIELHHPWLVPVYEGEGDEHFLIYRAEAAAPEISLPPEGQLGL